MDKQAAGAFPLDPQQTARVHDAVAGLSSAQLQWVSGFAAGLAAAGSNDAAVGVPAVASLAPDRQLTVLYGSQTGNGEGIAQALAAQSIDRQLRSANAEANACVTENQWSTEQFDTCASPQSDATRNPTRQRSTAELRVVLLTRAPALEFLQSALLHTLCSPLLPTGGRV